MYIPRLSLPNSSSHIQLDVLKLRPVGFAPGVLDQARRLAQGGVRRDCGLS